MRRTTGLLVLALLLGIMTVVPTNAVGTPPPTGGGGATGTWRVTLVTGDRVLAVKSGQNWSLSLDPSEHPDLAQAITIPVRRKDRTDWYLIPHRATKLVRAGVLDRELFNITELIRQGYDDAHADAVPLLLEYPDQGIAAQAQLAGTVPERTLAEVPLRSVAEPKRTAAEFWRSITGGSAPGALAGGPAKVWLNAKLSASLDESVPQIGAPTAWAAGYTGKDVTVAVLDSGVDQEHPDLAGRIGPTQDFTGAGEVRDGLGHGTHVASIIAGSGAASDGRYRGVAPDVRLAVGKVLDDQGNGQLDDIIAGMEWAATQAKAKVVNLSLGGNPTDGTDPGSLAVNALSKKYGTLFVVAAGNYGVDNAVAAPAAADAALAVGSVTKSDQLSEFSSRGPRVRDAAVKPEIAGPGSDIVAAKASGTQLGEPVGEQYLRLSGTSMATPHTAGAAAILAQQHPDWTAERLKATLVGSAAPVADASVFAVGGGRLDVARAVGQAVTSVPGTLNGYLKWPDTKPQRREITYRNSGNAPVTLSLDLALARADGRPAPTKLATLSTRTLLVPAGGTATATLIMTPAPGIDGIFSGRLVASTVDGQVRLAIPVSVYDEPRSFDLTVTMRNRDGAKPGPEDFAGIHVIDLDTGDWFTADPGEPLRLRDHRYSIAAGVGTPKAGAYPTITTFAHPELRLNRDTAITFDARKAKRVSASIDQPAARSGIWTSQLRMWPAGQPYPSTVVYWLEPRFYELYAYSTPGVRSSSFGYSNNWRLGDPDVELFVEQPRRFEVSAFWFDTSPRPDGTVRREAVHGGQGRPEDLAGRDVRGKLVVLDLPGDTTYEEGYQRIRNVADAGGAQVAINVTDTGTLGATSTRDGGDNPVVLPTIRLFGPSGQRFSELVKAGATQTAFTARAISRYNYQLSFPSAGRIPDTLTYSVRTADLATVRMAYHGYGAPPVAGAEQEALGGFVGTNWFFPAPAQAERVEHFTPGTWRIPVIQGFVVNGFGEHSTLTETVRLDGGTTRAIAWNAAVAGPGFAGTTSDELGQNHPWACRLGNLLNIRLPLLSDAADHPRPAQADGQLDTGSTQLYRNGSVLGTTALPGRGVFYAGAAEGAEYRLTADVTRDHPEWPLSTRVSGSWTFHEQEGQTEGCRALPLLAVRFAPPVDLRNATSGGREVSFPVTVTRQDGPAVITSPEVEISYDDGASWQPVAVRPDGGRWTATVTHPAGGFATLRAKATDANGNSVEQTVVRAYRIG